jgi:glycosyltransferase involved in cell wall biosynthesis
MHCPTLDELPPAPPDKAGWPWTERSPKLPENAPDGQPWPRVSIVTPSYNQGQFIEETIRSVVLQGYPNLEYFVIDGGSTDDSVAIIRKYESWLTYWVSEPDRGQSHAINKGFERATGEVFAWINSDDVYLPGAFAAVASAYRMAPGRTVAGSVMMLRELGGDGEREDIVSQMDLRLEDVVSLKFWEPGTAFYQPGHFFPASVWMKIGGLDASLQYVMDYDLLCRILQHTSVTHLSDVIAGFRVHQASKSVARKLDQVAEAMRVSQRYWHLLPGVDRRTAYSRCTDYLVRWAGIYALSGRYGDAIAFLRTSFALHRVETLRRLVAQSAAYVQRRTSGAG